MSVVTPALLTEAQSAEYLGISLSTIRRWRKQSGKGPAFFRVDWLIRYHKAELDKFIAEHTTQPSAGDE